MYKENIGQNCYVWEIFVSSTNITRIFRQNTITYIWPRRWLLRSSSRKKMSEMILSLIKDLETHWVIAKCVGNCKMCPVWAARELILQLRQYRIPPEKFADTPINYVELEGRSFTIPSSLILIRLRQVVSSIGPTILGFTADEIGTHSNRSGGAMGMFLAGTPVYTIMLMGHWSSDAFMRYIRKQVLSLSHRISSKMLTYERFFTVPDFVHNAADGDIHGWSNTNLASTSNFNGSHANMRRGLHPAFHLSH